MQELEGKIRKDIEDIKRLKMGINHRDGRPFIYQETDQIERGSPGRGNIGELNPQNGQVEYNIVTVRKDVPEKYKPIIVIHELVAIDTLSPEKAMGYEKKFARELLGEEEYQRYIKWISQFRQA